VVESSSGPGPVACSALECPCIGSECVPEVRCQTAGSRLGSERQADETGSADFPAAAIHFDLEGLALESGTCQSRTWLRRGGLGLVEGEGGNSCVDRAIKHFAGAWKVAERSWETPCPGGVLSGARLAQICRTDFWQLR
jgi:hypothetical protein